MELSKRASPSHLYLEQRRREAPRFRSLKVGIEGKKFLRVILRKIKTLRGFFQLRGEKERKKGRENEEMEEMWKTEARQVEGIYTVCLQIKLRTGQTTLEVKILPREGEGRDRGEK